MIGAFDCKHKKSFGLGMVLHTYKTEPGPYLVLVTVEAEAGLS